MALTASTHSLPIYRENASDREIPFHHQPSYITLSRTLTRLSNNLLPLSPSANISRPDLTPQQQLTLRDLLSPLHYQRTKTLHTIEHARTLLLQLEQSAQNIKIQRVKRDVVRDLAEKRKVIRKLRAVIEELSGEAERRERDGVHEGDGHDYDEGETVEELLGLPPLEDDKTDKHRSAESGINGTPNAAQQSLEQTPTSPSTFPPPPPPPPSSSNHPSNPSTITTSSSPLPQQKASLLNLNLRHRHRHPPKPPSPTSPTNPSTTETQLHHTDRLTHDALTTSLLSLATQLKSQSLALHTTLTTTDKTYLDRALRGLDANVSGLEAAGQKLGLLRRMSEGEGWWGRMLLYLWILAGWVGVLGLVVVGPKLRF